MNHCARLREQTSAVTFLANKMYLYFVSAPLVQYFTQGYSCRHARYGNDSHRHQYRHARRQDALNRASASKVKIKLI